MTQHLEPLSDDQLDQISGGRTQQGGWAVSLRVESPVEKLRRDHTQAIKDAFKKDLT